EVFRALGGSPCRFRGRRSCGKAGNADQPRVGAVAGVRGRISDRTTRVVWGPVGSHWRRGAIRRRAIRIAAVLAGKRDKAAGHLLWAQVVRVLGQNNCLLLLRAVSSYLPEEILSITRRVQTLLCSLALSSACFLPSSLARQAKPTATPPQQPQQKSLPTGPLAAPHSTHYPILLLGFGNQPNWNLRIGLKGPERLDRDGY